MNELDAYRKLHDSLSDMIEGGRLDESDIPDDYKALVEALASIPQPPTFTTYPYADVSTGHISAEDRDRLHEFALEEVHGGSAPITVAEYQFGFFISVPAELDNADEFENFKDKIGFSDAFLNMMKLASAQGIPVIRLDADGFDHDNLPKFKW